MHSLLYAQLWARKHFTAPFATPCPTSRHTSCLSQKSISGTCRDPTHLIILKMAENYLLNHANWCRGHFGKMCLPILVPKCPIGKGFGTF